MGDVHTTLCLCIQHCAYCLLHRRHYPPPTPPFIQATGFAGIGTNKGGTVVAFRYGGTPVAFINSHLAARAEEKRLQARNLNVKTIVENTCLGHRPFRGQKPVGFLDQVKLNTVYCMVHGV